MNISKYDELRKKNNKKDFEQNNKGLDWWLFRLSFFGNILSVFFSLFLVYPGLLKAIEINIIEGILAKLISFVITIAILVAFEVVKRHVIRNFSNEYVRNKMVLKSTGWLTISGVILFLSFYMSIIGSKNLGNIGTHKKNVIEAQIVGEKNNLDVKYENLKKPKQEYILELIEINKGINNKLGNTPIGWESVKNGYREDIKNNDRKIDETKQELDKLNAEYNQELIKIELKQTNTSLNIDLENIQNILLFIIIAIVSEILVLSGIHFREWYEHKLLINNQQKFEKFYLKRDRYRALTTFIYNNGKAVVGDKVISGIELKELLKEKANLPNKLVDEYLFYMDNANVFTVVGKRRHIAKTYQEALDVIENFEDITQILENMK